MKIFIDTFSLFKIDLLVKNSYFDIDILYKELEICITHKILEEIQYRKINSFDISKLQIFPIENQRIYQDAITQGFDEADASLLSLGSKNKDFVFVSEDKPLLELGRSYHFHFIQLIDFFRIMVAMHIIPSKKLYQVNRELRRLGNISKHKEKEIKSYLQNNSS